MSEAVEHMRHHAGWIITIGALLVVLSLFMFAAPAVVGASLTMAIGILMVLVGAVRIFYALRSKRWGSSFLSMLMGGLALVTGLLFLFRPLTGLSFLTLVLACFFFADGLFRIIFAFQLRIFGGWGWTFLSGFAALVLGIMILREWPLSGEWAIGILLGVHILISGWAMIALGLGIRKVAKHVS